MFNVWGPAPIQISEGYTYYVHFTDAFTRYTWLYLLKKKSNTLRAFTHFKTTVELQTGHKIKSLQTDGGGEYQALIHLLHSSGIIHRISCPYTPKQNGKAETQT